LTWKLKNREKSREINNDTKHVSKLEMMRLDCSLNPYFYKLPW